MGESPNCAKLPHMRWFVPLLLLLAPSAYGQEDAQLIAFVEGRYQEAARYAQTLQTADSYVFAARCLLADAMSSTNQDPPLAIVEEAERIARLALELDPDHIEGRLQLAIALSLRARPLSNRQAMRTGFGEEAKSLADSVLRDDPMNPYAHGFMAVWNIEVRRRGGSIGASIMGASLKDARAHYEAAIAAAPDEASTHWQYARALAALNTKRHDDEIEAALQAALSAEPDTHLEQIMQTRAGALMITLKEKGHREAQSLARQML